MVILMVPFSATGLSSGPTQYQSVISVHARLTCVRPQSQGITGEWGLEKAAPE